MTLFSFAEQGEIKYHLTKRIAIFTNLKIILYYTKRMQKYIQQNNYLNLNNILFLNSSTSIPANFFSDVKRLTTFHFYNLQQPTLSLENYKFYELFYFMFFTHNFGHFRMWHVQMFCCLHMQKHILATLRRRSKLIILKYT